jgi:hypothetical protein
MSNPERAADGRFASSNSLLRRAVREKTRWQLIPAPREAVAPTELNALLRVIANATAQGNARTVAEALGRSLADSKEAEQ